LILFLILAGRLYYLVQLYRVGLDAVSKFDPPQLLWTILGAVSFVIVAICVIVYLANFILKIEKTGDEANPHGEALPPNALECRT
jgi:hypothetical protein